MSDTGLSSLTSGVTSASLFSGARGADLGLEAAGLTPLWYCEVDRQCQDVIRHQQPGVPVVSDVRDLAAFANLPTPDVLWMSPPCQDLSVAGKRAGLDGSRSGLFYDAINVVRHFIGRRGEGKRKLRYVLMEQVPGLFSSNAAEDFREVLRAFLDLGALDVGWRVLDSQWFGVPQRRRRIFVVVDFGGRRAEQILALSEGVRRHTPTRIAKRKGPAGPPPESLIVGRFLESLGRGDRCGMERAWGEILALPQGEPQAVAATLSAGSKGSSNAPGRRREDDVNLTVAALTTKPHADNESQESKLVVYGMDADKNASVGFMGTLQAKNHHEQFIAHEVTHALTANGFDASEDGTGRGAPIVPVAFSGRARGDDGRGYERADHFFEDAVGALDTVKPFNVVNGMSVRRLTPREAERLQGWPDDHTRWGTKEDGAVYEMADGPRYRMCGNGVTKNVSEWIARNLLREAAHV